MSPSKKAHTIIQGGNVVLADRIVSGHDIVISDGCIAAIEPTKKRTASSSCEVVDAHNCIVAPGFVDIHSDYIENVASPRPSVVMDLQESLYGVDRSLVMHGVTTIYHSLSIYGSQIFDHKPIRHHKNVSQLIDLINVLRASETVDHLIRHRLHVRVELDSVGYYESIRQWLLDGKVDLISFMDHTPGQGQYRDLQVFAETLKSYRGDMDEAAVQELVLMRQSSKKFSMEQIGYLADLAKERGISVASHDDDCMETLEFIWGLGATISEFPISMDVASKARRLGMYTVAGAPNVLLGYSHSGNLSARESISAGATNILCSDYYPAALLKAVFELERSCGISLASAFALVTINPARAIGIDDAVGEIAVGKKADILLIRKLPQGSGAAALPVVEEVFVEGSSVFRTSYPSLHKVAAAQSVETAA